MWTTQTSVRLENSVLKMPSFCVAGLLEAMRESSNTASQHVLWNSTYFGADRSLEIVIRLETMCKDSFLHEILE